MRARCLGSKVSTDRPASKQARKTTFLCETLEAREYLSADPALGALASAAVEVAPLSGTASTPVYYTPAQIRAAYGFNQVSFGKTAATGAGQTIAIVDAYDDPNIAQDLAAFDKQFGLAAANLTKVEMQAGGKNPTTDAGWAMETALDVEWAHAIAPGANILLVEAHDSSLGSLLSAVDYARHAAGVSVVSMSWGASEFSGETSYDSYFSTPAGHAAVAFVASSGDSGKGVLWPAVSTNVLGVGGTSLHLTTGGAYSSETAWSGSGGGYSAYVSEPSWQKTSQTTGHRSTPDVSYDADTGTGFLVYDTVPYQGGTGWWIVGGTSAGAPQWAALIAIADQGLTAAHKADIGNAAQAIYGLSAADFHDITSGTNGYAAGKGYDAVTGRGSPLANKVIADLVGSTAVVSTASPATVAISTSIRGFLADTDPVQAWGFESSTLAIVGFAPAAVPLAPTNGAMVGALPTAGPAAERSARGQAVAAPAMSAAWQLGADALAESTAAGDQSAAPSLDASAGLPAKRGVVAVLAARASRFEVLGAAADRQAARPLAEVSDVPAAMDDCFAEDAWRDDSAVWGAGSLLPPVHRSADPVDVKPWAAAALALAAAPALIARPVVPARSGRDGSSECGKLDAR